MTCSGGLVDALRRSGGVPEEEVSDASRRDAMMLAHHERSIAPHRGVMRSVVVGTPGTAGEWRSHG